MIGRGLRCCLCVLTLLPILLVLGNGILRQDASGQGGADPSVVGQWSPLVDLGMEGIHVHLLPTGKVLIYGYHTDEPGKDTPRILDPATGAITSSISQRTFSARATPFSQMAGCSLLGAT
jgi:hypothetical protein